MYRGHRSKRSSHPYPTCTLRQTLYIRKIWNARALTYHTSRSRTSSELFPTDRITFFAAMKHGHLVQYYLFGGVSYLKSYSWPGSDVGGPRREGHRSADQEVQGRIRPRQRCQQRSALVVYIEAHRECVRQGEQRADLRVVAREYRP